jgi:hypothetical protein
MGTLKGFPNRSREGAPPGKLSYVHVTRSFAPSWFPRRIFHGTDVI